MKLPLIINSLLFFTFLSFFILFIPKSAHTQSDPLSNTQCTTYDIDIKDLSQHHIKNEKPTIHNQVAVTDHHIYMLNECKLIVLDHKGKFLKQKVLTPSNSKHEYFCQHLYAENPNKVVVGGIYKLQKTDQNLNLRVSLSPMAIELDYSAKQNELTEKHFNYWATFKKDNLIINHQVSFEKDLKLSSMVVDEFHIYFWGQLKGQAFYTSFIRGIDFKKYVAYQFDNLQQNKGFQAASFSKHGDIATAIYNSKDYMEFGTQSFSRMGPGKEWSPKAFRTDLFNNENQVSFMNSIVLSHEVKSNYYYIAGKAKSKTGKNPVVWILHGNDIVNRYADTHQDLIGNPIMLRANISEHAYLVASNANHNLLVYKFIFDDLDKQFANSGVKKFNLTKENKFKLTSAVYRQESFNDTLYILGKNNRLYRVVVDDQKKPNCP
jgi:hypothetical protein